jgi:hypothetical protein
VGTAPVKKSVQTPHVDRIFVRAGELRLANPKTRGPKGESRHAANSAQNPQVDFRSFAETPPG